eukprot:55412_1
MSNVVGQEQQRQINTATHDQAQQPCLSYDSYLKLIEGLAKYNATVSDHGKHNEIHLTNLEEILNQFEYVLQHPDQNQLLASKCVMFRRNARNRSQYKNKTNIYELYQMN